LTVEEIDRLCERLNAPPVLPSGSRLVLPNQLPRDALVEIVEWTQSALYLDIESSGREYWNPAKDWSGWDVCQHIQEVLSRHGLVPREEQTCEMPTCPAGPSDLSGLVSWAESQGLGAEDLDEAVHDHASGIGTRVNNEGLAGQIAFLVGQLGFAGVQSLLDEIAGTKNR
jgi:hypothetical protein